MFKYKSVILIALFAFCGAGFSFFGESIASDSLGSSLYAASKRTKKNSKKSEKKADEEKKETKKEDDSELLQDNEKSRDYMPDIYRCPDCGYEQDEAGFCPDHVSLALVKVITDNKDPLAPSEYDGNEDILVDVPLNIQFKKDEIESKKNEENQNQKKSIKKNSKRK